MRCFHIESTYSGVSVYFIFTHIARNTSLGFLVIGVQKFFNGVNICILIMHF